MVDSFKYIISLCTSEAHLRLSLRVGRRPIQRGYSASLLSAAAGLVRGAAARPTSLADSAHPGAAAGPSRACRLWGRRCRGISSAGLGVLSRRHAAMDSDGAMDSDIEGTPPSHASLRVRRRLLQVEPPGHCHKPAVLDSDGLRNGPEPAAPRVTRTNKSESRLARSGPIDQPGAPVKDAALSGCLWTPSAVPCPVNHVFNITILN